MRTVHTDVVIVGAGPAGAVLTELLARTKKSVLIVEQQSDPTSVKQSVMLQPVVIGLLQKLEIPHLFDMKGCRILGLEEYCPDGQVFSARYSSLNAPPVEYGQIISLGDLRGLLLSHVRRFPTVRLMTSTEIKGITRNHLGNCQIEVVGVDGAREPFIIESTWLVAADGKQSRTRELAGIDAQLVGFEYAMYLLRMPTPPEYPRIIRMHRDSDGLIVTIPEAAPGVTYAFGHFSDTVDEPDSLVTASARIVRTADPSLAEAMLAGVDRTAIMRITPHTVTTDTWRSDGVVLLGDSSHGMSSFGAQGLNISMQNAALLGVAMNGDSPDSSASAVDAVEHERRPFVEALQRAQHELGGQFWPPRNEEHSRFASRFEEFALGQREFRSQW